ncbi:MAG: hypothetical protein ACRD3Q_11140, partial [Terriglobales bacterium]
MMSQGFEEPTTSGPAPGPAEDTVEIELTGEQQLALSRAAKATQETMRPAESATGSYLPARDDFVYRRTARIDLVGTLTFAAAVLAVTAAFVWHAVDRQPAASMP